MKKLLYLFTFLLLFTSCHEEQTIAVEIDVELHTPEHLTSPLCVTIENKSRSASNFLWTFEGGTPATSSAKDPGVVLFTAPGEHLITLEAWNDGDRTTKAYTVYVDSAAAAFFRPTVQINNYAPAVFDITNYSSGGSTYNWTFEGGIPTTFEGFNPPEITYAREGLYTIILVVSNGSQEFTYSSQVEVRESIDASFSIIPSFEDEDDMEAPLRATFDTQLHGVESVKWQCEGATITNSDKIDASIYFPKEGTYTVYLNASNGKQIKRTSQTIVVKENTNLRTFNDIRLGINTAQNTIGSFFSTKLRESFKSSDVTTENGSLIDIAFMGLNTTFNFNYFVSPSELGETPLSIIPNATQTWFVNLLEQSSISFTAEQFKQMTTDVLLKNLPIKEQANTKYFTKSNLPRVVLFETNDGRKGAVLVKEMITNGATDSYIVVDIKVQKND